MTMTSASVVQYGRRKGLSRENTVKKDIFDIDPSGQLISKGIDLRQVTILPKQEWERIQDNLNNPDKEIKRILAEIKEKKDLHLRSREVVKHWTNTIAGQRQKRLTAKILREEREEEEKKRIDLEEAKYQAEKRREAIENAQLKQYYMNDRVKYFHSGLLLTQAMKEREAQIELKKKMYLLNKKKEQEPEEGLLKERRTAHEQFLARKAEYDDMLEQIQQHIHEKKLEKLEDKREGEEIQKLTRLYELEMQKKHEAEQEQKMEQMKAYRAYVADRDLLRAVEKQNIEEEDEKIRLYVKAKQNLSKFGKEKEMEIQREKKKEKQQTETKLRAVQNLHAIQEADIFFLEQQKEKMKRMKDECLELQDFLIQQMVDKRTKSRLAKEADREYETQNEVVRVLEEKRFQEYAQDVIDSAIKAGQNPYPLLHAARAGIGGGHGLVCKERGSIQPSYQSQDSSAVELPTYNGTTTKGIKSFSVPKDIQETKK